MLILSKKWLGGLVLSKKLMFASVLAIFLLTACGGQAADEMKSEAEDKPKQEEVEKEEKQIDVKIDVNEELSFEQFDVNLKKVRVYEEDNKILADISLEWRNNAYDYGSDEMTFFVATTFEVKQGDNELEEINDAWNPENKSSSNDVFFPNALGGLWGVELTYELTDKTTPIDIIFTPNTETEGSETITVDIPE